MTHIPYPTYIPREGWLGSIPTSWTSAPLWAVVSCNDEVLPERTDPNEIIQYVEISGVTSGLGITEISEMPFGTAPSRARRKVRDGDVLVSTVRTYLRAIAPVEAPPSNMIVSTGFAVLRARHIIPSYLGYALQAEYFISEVISRSVGVSYPAINASDLMRIEVPVPPAPEQTAIAAFLDRETGKIDALVEEQRLLIELLKEKRQAVISHSVTKGLDLNAKLKPSGVEWLGEVPEHWELRRGRTLFRQLDLPPLSTDGVVTAFRDGQVTLRELRRTDGYTLADLEVGYQHVREGDLVINGMDAFAGAMGVAEAAGKCTPEYTVLTQRDGHIDNHYFGSVLRLMAQRNFVYVICPSVRERAPRFRFETFKDVVLPVPPLQEQQDIAALVSSISRETIDLIYEFERMIDLLGERRAGLISAAVTGKIDVREVSSGAKAA